MPSLATDEPKSVDIITLEMLVNAIINSSQDRTPVNKDEAETMARSILNFFSYSNIIIDNVLEEPDRDLFYTMEYLKLLTTKRVSTTLYDGREVTLTYWRLKRNRIHALSQSRKGTPEDAGEMSSL